MKLLSSLLIIMVICSGTGNKETTFRGSTPADKVVRKFLGMSLTDSIDFIRWRLVIYPNRYKLDCEYGLSKGGTNGFTHENKISFAGKTSKQGHYYYLHRENKTFSLFEINDNILHILDENKKLLAGNGGYSYALNNIFPVRSSQFHYPSKHTTIQPVMAYQGRTPCQELSALLGRESSAACNKLKWYIILFTDSATGKPTYYLEGGRQYRKETMTKGSWEITRKNERTIYKLQTEKRPKPLYLLKADDSILFITDAAGNLLVGNEDFSYTLNRTVDREPKTN